MRTWLTLAPLVGSLACASSGAVLDGVKEDKPGLFQQAAIKPDSARRIALNRVTGGSVDEAELEMEDGRLIYAFALKVTGQKGETEVIIDARTGEVVKIEKK